MNYTREQKLQAIIGDIQKKWGGKAIRKASAVSRVNDCLSTGFPSLDVLIGGGVARGCLTEIVGSPTSGMTSLTLRVMATAQKQGDGVVYFDLSSAFDPASALHCGVNPAELVLIRDDLEGIISMLPDIVGSGIPALVVFNTFPQLPRHHHYTIAETIKRVMPYLAATHCSLLLLSLPSPGRSLISQHATLRLRTSFGRWLTENGDVCGFQSVITVLKYKGGNENRKVAVPVLFDDKTGGTDT